MNTNIQTLLDYIKDFRLKKLTKDNNDFDNRQNLLSTLKITAKNKGIEIEELTTDMFMDVVKTRFNKARYAAITIVSKSDKDDIGGKVALVVLDESGEKSITYDELTLEQILLLNPINTNLQSLVAELDYLYNLLPKQLTEEDIRTIITNEKLIGIKDIMTYFKTNYSNRYNSKLLSNIAKTV